VHPRVRHSHGADDSEEYHVVPAAEHAHLRCLGCGGSREVECEKARSSCGGPSEDRGFIERLSHVMIGGYWCGSEPTGA
jgi:Fe2+ or Zn2+ uptake regulation protein